MTTNSNLIVEMKIQTNVLLLTYIFYLSDCVRLNPLENNDRLQAINSQFIAEWQWESWPIKQNLSEKDSASPGPRTNAALWRDNSGMNWYLFGGQPINPESEKVYSDIWKYSISSRVWERIFPFLSPQGNKGKYSGKIGGMVSLRVNFFDEYDGKKPHKYQGNNVILCGRSAKRNMTKTKKNLWSNFSRRKPVELKPNLEESKSLAVYVPRTAKSNTVWQIDLKDKLWTGYVCCCDTSNYDKVNPSLKDLESDMIWNKNIANQSETPETTNVQGDQPSMNDEIDRTEDEVDSEQEHMTIESAKNMKKPSQIKKKTVPQNNYDKKKVKKVDNPSKKNQTLSSIEKIQNELNYLNGSRGRDMSQILKDLSTETVLLSRNSTNTTTTTYESDGNTRDVRDFKNISSETKTWPYGKELAIEDWDGRINLTDNGKSSSKLASKYCPDFTDEEEPVSWCDGNNDALITTDLNSTPIILWVFNLKTSHWSQQPVEIADDTPWPVCSNTSSMRYAGANDEVYVLCSGLENENFPSENVTSNSTSDNSKTVSETDKSTKLVYRISSKRLVLESLGKIKLDRFFKEQDHSEIWGNESSTILQIVRISKNETILLLAYKDKVDLWILLKNSADGYYFEPIENVWRGSALKWFDKYNSANYNLHLVSEGNTAATTLILNPRSIPFNEYWPRERGRFIIRIMKNENLKNHSFGNQTREHNLTYDLLQSDVNLPVSDSSFSHSYNLKVIIFFSISLAIFTIFGVVIFLKKCVNCPSRILIQNECNKSPPVIRYSVMHDDLLYPVA